MEINLLTIVSLFFYYNYGEYFYSYSTHRFDFINFWVIVALAVCIYGIVIFVRELMKKIPQWKKRYIENRKNVVEGYRQYLINCDNNGKVALSYKQWVFAYTNKNTHKHVIGNNKKHMYVYIMLLLGFVCGCMIIKCNMTKYHSLSVYFTHCLSINLTADYLFYNKNSWDDVEPVYIKHCDDIAEKSWKNNLRNNKSWIDAIFDKW